MTALDFGLSLLKLLFPDERFGYMANDMSILCIWKAGIYASRKDREKTLSALAESVSYAIEGSEVGENFRFTAPLVNRVGYNPKLSSKNYKGNACDLRLEELDARFDFVRENEKFKGFVERLKQHAEELQQVK